MTKYLCLALFIMAAMLKSSSAGAGDDAAVSSCKNLQGLWMGTWYPLLKPCGVNEMHFSCSEKGAAGISLVPSTELKKFISPDDSKTAFCGTWTGLSRLFLHAEKSDVHCAVNKENGVIKMEAVPGKAVNGDGPTNPCGLWKEVQGAWEKCLHAIGFSKFTPTCKNDGKKATMEIVLDPRRDFSPAVFKDLWVAVFDKLCKMILAGQNIKVTAVAHGDTILVTGDTVNAGKV